MSIEENLMKCDPSLTFDGARGLITQYRDIEAEISNKIIIATADLALWKLIAWIILFGTGIYAMAKYNGII